MVSFRDDVFGAPGLETLVPLMGDHALNGPTSFERLFSLLAESPARIFGIPQKGCIALRLDADLLVIDPNDMTMVHGQSSIEPPTTRSSMVDIYLAQSIT